MFFFRILATFAGERASDYAIEVSDYQMVRNLYFCLLRNLFDVYFLNYCKYMKELLNQIQEAYKAFETDAQLQVEKGNKAAGTRARQASLSIEKLMKTFRKVSLEASKK